MAIDLSKKPEGATHYSTHPDGRLLDWFKINPCGTWLCWWDTYWKTTEERDGIMGTLYRILEIPVFFDLKEDPPIKGGVWVGDGAFVPVGAVPQGARPIDTGIDIEPNPHNWNGEGLPPVGAVCEVRNSGLHNPVWEKCTILFCGKHRVLYDSESCYERCAHIEDLEFRPIRTPEQIAADKRLHEIRNALSAINSKVHFPNDLVRGNILAAAVEAMIDAGYRKPEIVDE